MLLLNDGGRGDAKLARDLRSELLDITVETADDGEAFERSLEIGSFDLVLAGHELQWIDGHSVMQAVRDRYPNRPVILFSANGYQAEEQETGEDDTKKNISKLTSAIRTALEGNRAVRSGELPELRYQNLFDRLPVGLYRSTPDGTFLDVNYALVKTLGYPNKSALLSRQAEDLYIHEEDRKRRRSIFERNREIRNFETQVRRYDGQIIWIREHARVSWDSRFSRAYYYEGSIEDITRAKEAETRLQESEERFRLLSSSAFEGIGIHDQGRILDANETMAQMFGYELPDLIGMNGLELSAPESRPLVMRHIATGNEEPYEVIGLRHDGSTFPVEIVGKSIPYEGRTVRVLALRDITAHKRAVEALRESEEKYSNLFHQSSDAIMIYGLDGRVVDVNKKAVELSGYSRSDLLSLRMQDLLPEEDSETVEEVECAISQGASSDFETRLLRHSGEKIPVEISASRFEVSGQGLVQWSVRDTRDRNRLQNQLRQAQRMEAVGRLAGGVAHDFNNLLTVITMYCDLLLTRFERESPLRGDVDQIKKAGERAASLTRQLLAFSRQQVLRPRVLDLNTVVSDLGKMLRRLIREDIDLRTELDPQLGLVKADPGQLEQVLMNLVVNARDAMPGGGELSINTANYEVQGDSKLPNEGIMRRGPYVRLSVGDTGVGIDQETLARIFEPFFTTKERGKGTGLGLSTVYGIVKQSDGFVFAESQPEEGTAFHVYLPRVSEPLSDRAKKDPEQGQMQGSETVLVVEDEAELRNLVGEVLKAKGYTVLQAANGAEAMETIQRHAGRIHMLLTDLVMPGMSGHELAERILARLPDLKILYMSGYSDEAIVKDGFLRRGGHLLEKPFTAQVLAQKVSSLLREGDRETLV